MGVNTQTTERLDSPLDQPSDKQINHLLQRSLFEQLPFNLAVIDRHYNVIRANQNFRDYFGDWHGKKCHEVYKGRDQHCEKCKADQVFAHGETVVSDETGEDRLGRICHYVVHTIPIMDDDGKVQFLLELSRDITTIRQFQREYDVLFDRVPCYISVIDKDFKIIRANEKFRSTFGKGRGNYCYKVNKRRDKPCAHCPAAKTFRDGQEHKGEQVGVTKDGKPTYYVVYTAPLSRGDGDIEHVIEIMTDVTHVKELEKQNIEAERLAAVGQTVAGLAHTIKNLLMGLEGGMYMVDSGLKKGNNKRIEDGWEVLQRNFSKTTDLVRGFLNFSKGRIPEMQVVDPNKVVRDIIELYEDTAAQQDVNLIPELDEKLKEAPLDPDGMEACLTNLMSNAIDAVTLRDEGEKRVVMRTCEEEGELRFEVVDNGAGMDQEVKNKIFTTFFTTKGGKGTGLGLLTTRKIVQEHGGRIEMKTEEGVGSTFTIRLPRKRLNVLYRDQQKEKQE